MANWMDTGAFSAATLLGRPGDSDDEPDEQEEVVETGPKPKKMRIYESCGLVSRTRERNELGDPGPRKNCFGCCYIGEREEGAIEYEDIMALIDMIRTSIARTDIINLSLHVAKRYAKFQKRINENLMPGEKPLPDWTAATVLDHIRNHNTDPEVQTWVRLSELQELLQVALHASVEVDEETGDKRINEKQYKAYIDLAKMMETVYKSDPTKKVFYSGGAHIDMKTGAQGPLALSGKNFVDFLKTKKRKR